MLLWGRQARNICWVWSEEILCASLSELTHSPAHSRNSEMWEDTILQSFYCAHVDCPSDFAMKLYNTWKVLPSTPEFCVSAVFQFVLNIFINLLINPSFTNIFSSSGGSKWLAGFLPVISQNKALFLEEGRHWGLGCYGKCFGNLQNNVRNLAKETLSLSPAVTTSGWYYHDLVGGFIL